MVITSMEALLLRVPTVSGSPPQGPQGRTCSAWAATPSLDVRILGPDTRSPPVPLAASNSRTSSLGSRSSCASTTSTAASSASSSSRACSTASTATPSPTSSRSPSPSASPAPTPRPSLPGAEGGYQLYQPRATTASNEHSHKAKGPGAVAKLKAIHSLRRRKASAEARKEAIRAIGIGEESSPNPHSPTSSPSCSPSTSSATRTTSARSGDSDSDSQSASSPRRQSQATTSSSVKELGRPRHLRSPNRARRASSLLVVDNDQKNQVSFGLQRGSSFSRSSAATPTGCRPRVASIKSCAPHWISTGPRSVSGQRRTKGALARASVSSRGSMMSAASNSKSSPHFSFRCKLYEFRGSEPDAQEWVDLGTGYVFCDLRQAKRQTVQRPNNNGLCDTRGIMRIRSDTSLIKEFVVMAPESYHMQTDGDEDTSRAAQETIIVWEDIQGKDFALSLERTEDAKHLYDVLRNNVPGQDQVGNPIGNPDLLNADDRATLVPQRFKRRKILPESLTLGTLANASAIVSNFATNFLGRQQLAQQGYLNTGQPQVRLCDRVIELGGPTVQNRRLCAAECGEENWLRDIIDLYEEIQGQYPQITPPPPPAQQPPPAAENPNDATSSHHANDIIPDPPPIPPPPAGPPGEQDGGHPTSPNYATGTATSFSSTAGATAPAAGGAPGPAPASSSSGPVAPTGDKLDPHAGAGASSFASSAPHQQSEPPGAQYRRDLFELVRNMFCLADPGLVRKMLAKEYFFSLLGIIEWDQGLSRVVEHREILKRKVKYKKVVDFASDEVVRLVELNFRVQYIRDVALARLLDDVNLTVLNQIVGHNLCTLIEHISNETKPVLEAIIDQLDAKDWLTLDFVAEALRTVRYQSVGVQLNDKEKLFSTFARQKIFNLLVPFLLEPETPLTEHDPSQLIPPPPPDDGHNAMMNGSSGMYNGNGNGQHSLPTSAGNHDSMDPHNDRLFPVRRAPHPSTRTVALDILQMYAYHNPSMIRSHAIKEPTWLKKIASLLLLENDQPTQSLVAELLRWSLDFEASHNPQLSMLLSNCGSYGEPFGLGVQKVTPQERDGFLEILYDKSNGVMLELVAALKDKTKFPENVDEDAKNFARQCILDILSTGLGKGNEKQLVPGGQRGPQEQWQLILFLVQAAVADKACRLLSVPCKFLHISVLKFVRAMVTSNKNQLHKNLTKCGEAVWRPIFNLMKEELERMTSSSSTSTSAQATTPGASSAGPAAGSSGVQRLHATSGGAVSTVSSNRSTTVIRYSGNSLLSAILALMKAIADGSLHQQSVRDLIKYLFENFENYFTEPYVNRAAEMGVVVHQPPGGSAGTVGPRAAAASQNEKAVDPREVQALTKLYMSWRTIVKTEEITAAQEANAKREQEKAIAEARSRRLNGRGPQDEGRYVVEDAWFEQESDDSSSDDSPAAGGPHPPPRHQLQQNLNLPQEARRSRLDDDDDDDLEEREPMIGPPLPPSFGTTNRPKLDLPPPRNEGGRYTGRDARNDHDEDDFMQQGGRGPMALKGAGPRPPPSGSLAPGSVLPFGSALESDFRRLLESEEFLEHGRRKAPMMDPGGDDTSPPGFREELGDHEDGLTADPVLRARTSKRQAEQDLRQYNSLLPPGMRSSPDEDDAEDSSSSPVVEAFRLREREAAKAATSSPGHQQHQPQLPPSRQLTTSLSEMIANKLAGPTVAASSSTSSSALLPGSSSEAAEDRGGNDKNNDRGLNRVGSILNKSRSFDLLDDDFLPSANASATASIAAVSRKRMAPDRNSTDGANRDDQEDANDEEAEQVSAFVSKKRDTHALREDLMRSSSTSSVAGAAGGGSAASSSSSSRELKTGSASGSSPSGSPKLRAETSPAVASSAAASANNKSAGTTAAAAPPSKGPFDDYDSDLDDDSEDDDQKATPLAPGPGSPPPPAPVPPPPPGTAVDEDGAAAAAEGVPLPEAGPHDGEDQLAKRLRTE